MPSTVLEHRRRAIAEAFREARSPSRDDVVDLRLRDVEHQVAAVQLRVASTLDRLDELDAELEAALTVAAEDRALHDSVGHGPVAHLDLVSAGSVGYAEPDEDDVPVVSVPAVVVEPGGMSAAASRALFGV